MRIPLFFFMILCACFTQAQVQQFPFSENFDRVTAPSLPPDWNTSANRSSAGDFTTTRSTPFSDSNCVISTNATISQSLFSPLFDFSNSEADSIQFYERRSGSHNSGLILEASTNDGSTFTVQITDTIKNPGTTSYVRRSYKLPAQLNNQQQVKFRCRVIGNGTGTTGTIRLDNISINARFQYDLAVTRVTVTPQFPNAGESLDIHATIQNSGTQPVQNYSVEFYIDANSDSIPDPTEIFSSAVVNQRLQPGDTLLSTAHLDTIPYGENVIILKVILAGDQNISNNVKHSRISAGLPRRSVVINEILYAPLTGEPEWIELFNTTVSSIDLKNWKVSNRNSNSKYLISSASFILNSKSYCVITKDTALFKSVYVNFASTIIQSSALPASLLSNSGDAAVIYDAHGALLDSLRYSPSWGGTGGLSLERIEFNESSTDSMNWSPSGDSTGSTPGMQNYNTPLEFNLCVLRVSAVNFSPVLTTITVTIQNKGHQSAQIFSISLFNDVNEDSIPQSSEILQTLQSSATLHAKDSVVMMLNWDNPPSGKKHLIAKVDFPPDMRSSDNIASAIIKTSFPANTLIINEIMYEPVTGLPEYVELFNRSSETIDVRDWKVSDIRDTSTTSSLHRITNTPMRISSGEYLIIGSDSSIYLHYPYLSDSTYHVVIRKSGLGLNNTGDDILLTDLTGELIDSVRYSSGWHNADVEQTSGRSLERINPNLSSNDKRNWSTSASSIGGTPGKKNSLFTAVIPAEATISFVPNPFSPDNDGFEDVTIMSYKLPAATSLIRVRIYDVNGRLIRTLTNGEPSGVNGEIIWDGFNDSREKARIGIYIVLLEAIDGNGGSVQTVKGAVVVAAQM